MRRPGRESSGRVTLPIREQQEFSKIGLLKKKKKRFPGKGSLLQI